MNPCSKCGAEPQLEVNSNNTAFMYCGNCDYIYLYNYWNDNNPIPEPDPLAIAHEQLAECYELLEQIYLMMIPYSTKTAIKELLAKHRSANND